MQNNKTKLSAAVKRLIALSLVTAVGLGNVPLQARAQNDDEFFFNSESSSSDEEGSSSNSESSSSEQDNDDLYVRTQWTEQETQQLLAIAYMDNRPQFEPEPASNQAPQQNQASTRTCLRAAIRFLAMAFRPCFRGVLGSHKKD